MSTGHSFASRTTFEALAVDSGEESEHDPVAEAPHEEEVHAKPRTLGQKKTSKTSRLERKQQKSTTKAQRTEPLHTETPLQSGISSQPPLPPPSHHSVDSAKNTNLVPPHQPLMALPMDGRSRSPESLPSNGVQISRTEDAVTSPPTVHSAEKPIVLGDPLRSPPGKQYKTVMERNQPTGRETAVITDAHESEKLKEQKRRNVVTRTLWTFIMIGGFIGLLLLGHAYMVLLVIVCQTLVYREVTALFSLRSSKPESTDESKGKDPWRKTLNWYFFAVTNYFLYGESIIYYFKHVVFADAQLLPFATNHRIISFTLYTIGFVGFVMSLKKGYLKQQFGLFCWVHMSLLLVVVSSHFIVNNILEGLIWFWVPASLVICNDVFAYIWGITTGRTPLIKLSPKKTVEGFVGAFWSTIVFGIVWGTCFMRYDYMICPVHDLGVSAWSSTHCKPNPIFVWREWEIWTPLSLFLSAAFARPITTIPYAPYQLHLLFMSCFASLVAPFGGFFASGFKRAFNIKDFGHSIPGHGGMTDRMDCQFLMGVFTYVYYSSLIRENHVTVGSILQTIVSGLTLEEQLELLGDLKKYLAGQGVLI